MSRTDRWSAWPVTLSASTVIIAAVGGGLAYLGWTALGSAGALAAIRVGQLRYAGPVVLGVVALVLLAERRWPAQARPLLAAGHRMDLLYLLAYAAIVLPLVTLFGAGFATLLEHHAGWAVLPPVPGMPRWSLVIAGLLLIDAGDWFVHLINHRLGALWRLHAVHHSQEELSVLSTFRAHPLVHLSFLVTAVPAYVLTADVATPAELMITYACLGTLPHANVGWTYGRLGRVMISPAYHRLHHRPTGRLDVNLGVVFPFWDRCTGRAVFPAAAVAVPATGLAGRPVPVEQVPGRLITTFVRQWAEPFGAPPPRRDGTG